MTRPSTLRRAPLFALLAAAALLVALAALACGDDEEPTPAPPPPTSSPTATATEAATAAATAEPTATPTPEPTSTPSPEPTEPPAFPLTIEDSDGTPVTLESAPERIISYSPGATEILFAIGAGDRVAATDEFSDFPPETADLPKLAYSEPDPEPALALGPDLVIMASRQREQIEQFRGLGMTVMFIDSGDSLDGVFATIEQLGRITGNGEQAAALAASMRARIEAITEAIAGVEEGPRAFFELTADLYTVGPETFVGELLTLAKARNVAAGAATPFPQLSAEAIIDADPEVVLLADGEWGESLETVCARPGWDATSACVNERVHPVDGDLTSRPGPRVVEGLEEIARLLYPDRFP